MPAWTDGQWRDGWIAVLVALEPYVPSLRTYSPPATRVVDDEFPPGVAGV